MAVNDDNPISVLAVDAIIVGSGLGYLYGSFVVFFISIIIFVLMVIIFPLLAIIFSLLFSILYGVIAWKITDYFEFEYSIIVGVIFFIVAIFWHIIAFEDL